MRVCSQLSVVVLIYSVINITHKSFTNESMKKHLQSAIIFDEKLSQPFVRKVNIKLMILQLKKPFQ